MRAKHVKYKKGVTSCEVTPLAIKNFYLVCNYHNITFTATPLTITT